MREDTLVKLLFAAIEPYLNDIDELGPVCWDDPDEHAETIRRMCRAGADALSHAINPRVDANQFIG